ncbi:crossover junction endodeoxyribonuclease RuvC [Neobacillus niacini]|uniref:crossover junction endodeoxyribonuclease RuvC n=1 Tax=Neobacillus driksii TaxID=3035913 RepID=UPI00278A792E|nr:crossover junction endodeoxyribonuclease RuvC [Neobacillus niacini]MDQ0976677.1 crossover junction endodeoxyribonuclease RuvC [Neobacillus niacini]
MSNKKLILAIDSSLACPAFAVCEVNLITKNIKVIEVSHVKTNSKKSTGFRLFQIWNHANDILDRYTFDAVVFEKGFNKFAVATQQIQRTVGLLLFTLYCKEVENIDEIAPTSVKKAVTGNGKATKEQLAEALESYVGVVKYKTNDESDAVGVAIALALQKGWI